MLVAHKLRWCLVIILLAIWAGQLPYTLYLVTTIISVVGLSLWQQTRAFGWGLGLLGLTVFSYSQWQPHYLAQQDTLPAWHNQVVQITGVIDSWPEQRATSQRVLVQTQAGRFLLVGDLDQAWEYGQAVTVTGKLQAPRNFADFDYRRYLARFNVRSLMPHPKEIELGLNTFWLRPAVRLRNWFEDNLTLHLPRPNRELAAGVLIGTKSELPEPVQTRFKQAGLQHLIVVSGSNVVILMALIAFLTQSFGPILKMCISGLTLILFVFITGADPPVVRAALLASVVLMAHYHGQLIDIRNSWLLAGVLMGFFNPLLVQQDVSFWLSFAATGGIILGFPLYQRWTQSIKINPVLKAIFGVSLTAQLAVLPILIMAFGTFPWAGIISNLLAEPIIPLTMLSSLIAGLSGLMPELAPILTVPAFVTLHQLAHVFGRWPGINLPTWAGQVLAGVWIMVALWALFSAYYQVHFWNPLRQNLDARHAFTDYDGRT